MVEENYPRVSRHYKWWLSRFAPYWRAGGIEGYSDLRQQLVLALMRSIKKWDPEKGRTWPSYLRYALRAAAKSWMRRKITSLARVRTNCQELLEQIPERLDPFIALRESLTELRETVGLSEVEHGLIFDQRVNEMTPRQIAEKWDIDRRLIEPLIQGAYDKIKEKLGAHEVLAIL